MHVSIRTCIVVNFRYHEQLNIVEEELSMSLGHSISQPFENEEMDLKLSRVFHAIFTMFMGIKLYNLNCLHEEEKKKKLHWF